MRWADLAGRRIYLDANIVIYTFEGGTRWTPQLEEMVRLVNAGALDVFTSELTLTEVIVKPMREGATDVVGQYERLLSPISLIRTIPIDRAVLRLAAVYRAEYALKLADAIHVATAQAASCTHFFSNDTRLNLPDGLAWLAPDEIAADA